MNTTNINTYNTRHIELRYHSDSGVVMKTIFVLYFIASLYNKLTNVSHIMLNIYIYIMYVIM